MDYAFMTKGQLCDFFGKATISEKNGIIEVTAENVYVKGDKLTIQVKAATNPYLNKDSQVCLAKILLTEKLNKYEKFSSGVKHGSYTILNMPGQKMKIDAKNQDYSQRVK